MTELLSLPLGLSGGAFELEPAADVVAADELPTAAAFDESLCCVRGIRLAFKLGCIANSASQYKQMGRK